jgi:hypothetical protein
MSGTAHWRPISIWHHRVLGGLWALCGLVTIINVLIGILRHGSWAEYQSWVCLSVAFVYVVTGIGFVFARTWARRSMGVLMVVAVLLSLDMMLMSGVGGNRQGVREMLVGAGIAAYTLLFLAISAAWHSQDSP